jgi:hypothetical protein
MTICEEIRIRKGVGPAREICLVMNGAPRDNIMGIVGKRGADCKRESVEKAVREVPEKCVPGLLQK